MKYLQTFETFVHTLVKGEDIKGEGDIHPKVIDVETGAEEEQEEEDAKKKEQSKLVS